jgi:hypothetical protein
VYFVDFLLNPTIDRGALHSIKKCRYSLAFLNDLYEIAGVGGDPTMPLNNPRMGGCAEILVREQARR